MEPLMGVDKQGEHLQIFHSGRIKKEGEKGPKLQCSLV